MGTKSLLEKIKKNFKLALQLELAPIVIVTKIDGLPLDEIEELKSVLANELQVPEQQLFMIKNYTIESEKCFQLDKSSLQILRAALQSAQSYVMYNVKPEADRLDLDLPAGAIPLTGLVIDYFEEDDDNRELDVAKVGSSFDQLNIGLDLDGGVMHFSGHFSKEVLLPIKAPLGNTVTTTLVCSICGLPGIGRFCKDDGGSLGPPTRKVRLCGNCGHSVVGSFSVKFCSGCGFRLV